IPRNEDATAELYQRGSHGYGRLVFEGTDAAESVPISLRRGGLTGARVQFDLSGNSLTMKHELGGHSFAIDFKVDGDRMVGRVRNTETPVRVVLERVHPPAPVRAPVAVVPEPAPPPPAPIPVAPEPPKTPDPQAAAPPGSGAARADTGRAADPRRLCLDSRGQGGPLRLRPGPDPSQRRHGPRCQRRMPAKQHRLADPHRRPRRRAWHRRIQSRPR